MGVSFHSLNDEQSQTLKSYGLLEDPKIKFTYRGSPTPHVLSSILQFHPNEQRYIPGAVPFNGYLAYVFALRAMKLFSYISQFSRRKAIPIRLPPIDSSTPRTTPYNCIDGPVTLYSASGDQEQVDLTTIIGAKDENMIVSASQAFVASRLTNHDVIYNTSIALDEAVPDGKGILFPYFENMVQPDREFAANVFSRLFFRCLGDTLESCSRLWIRLRIGFRSLAITSAGQAISHAFMGIQLAENSQSKITFVIDHGIYHGFILTGDITVIHNGATHTGDEPKELQKSFSSLDVKAQKILEIIQIIRSEVDISGRHLYPVSLEEISSSYKIFRKYHELRVASFPQDKLVAIMKLAQDIPFGDTYLEPSPSNLQMALDYISNGRIDTLENKNIYLKNGAFTSELRIPIAMLIFGPLVPSINYGMAKDNTITIPSPESIDINLVEKDGKRSLPYLAYKLVSHQTAVNQYDMLFSKGKFMIPNGRKGKAEFTDRNKCDGDYGGTSFLSLYQRVKEIVNTKRAGSGPRKRKIGEANEGEGSKRQRRFEEDDNDAMLI